MTRQTRSLIILSSLVSLGGFLFGFDAAIISGAGGLVVRDFGLSDLQFGLLVGAPSIAAIVAGLLVGPLSDLLGRRLMLIIVAVLYAASALASALAPNYDTLVAARALGGFAFASLVLAPLYIAEIAPSDARGRLVSINQLNIVVGFAVAYFAGYFIIQAAGVVDGPIAALNLDETAWRWMLGIELLPAGLFFLALLIAPESPRWLMVRGKEDKARAVVARYHAAENIDAEIEEIRDSIESSRSKAKTPFHVFLNVGVLKLLAIGLIVAVAQQITGINAVYFYAQTIFELAGAGTNAAFAQATAIGIVNIIFTLLAILAIDFLGRKPLMIIGLTGVVVSMSLAGFGFQQARFTLDVQDVPSLSAEIDRTDLAPMVGVTYESDVAFREALYDSLGEDAARIHQPELTNKAIDINAGLVLAGILGFVASFAVSLGPVMWVLLSEIFPNRIRGLAMSAITFVNAGVSSVVQVAFPLQVANLGAGFTFYTYAAFGLLFLVLVFIFLPETKQKTLEEWEAERTG